MRLRGTCRHVVAGYAANQIGNIDLANLLRPAAEGSCAAKGVDFADRDNAERPRSANFRLQALSSRREPWA
jgi:hypothetical protein